MSFYDRYLSRVANGLPLANVTPLADKFPQAGITLVGFGFPFQIVDAVPFEPHDMKMTHVIGEKNIFCC